MRPPIHIVKMFCMLILLAACSKKSGSGSTVPPPVTQTDITAVNTNVQALMTTYNIPGASLAVTKNGKLVYIKAFGNADNSSNEKVTTAHRFRIASVSKTLTGIGIMKLVQSGSISLDQKVFGTGAILGTTYGTTAYSANLKNITVSHLLHHTSGGWGAASGGDPIDMNPSYTDDQFFSWVLDNRPITNAPGTKFDYSNMGYFVLARIIEKVSGKTYFTYIKDNVLTPAGATNTELAGITLADRKPSEVKYYGQGSDAPYVYNIAFNHRDGDAGFITTPADLLRIITEVDGFSSRPDILNSATIAAFTTPSGAAPLDPNYGCGIAVWNNVWYNYGSLPGTRSGFMRGNNGICVALMLNSRVDPTTNENPFVYAMQDFLLDIVNNGTYSWQDIDQF